MIWWWIGNIVLALVVIPVVVLLATRVVRPVMEIKAYAEDILEHGVGITRELDAVPALLDTVELSAAAKGLAGRYLAGLTGGGA